jgi:transposase
MTYPLSFKKRVIRFVHDGGSRHEAAELFEINRMTVRRWLKAKCLKPKKRGPRKRKFDWESLRRDVEQYPDKPLRERAQTFGVVINAVWRAMRTMEIGRRRKRNPDRRARPAIPSPAATE